MNDIKFTFDGNYLVAELNDSVDVVKYQMEMLTHNSINYLLPVKKQAVNNCIYLYYEIVGRMALDRLIMHKKLTDEAYLDFVKGALMAARELGEYQLSVSGMVLDSSYIFVHPAENAPNFVYLPINANTDGLPYLLNYLKNMLVSDMVEMKNSSVMQQVISVLNSGLSLNDMITRLSGNSTGLKTNQTSSGQINKVPEYTPPKREPVIQQAATSKPATVIPEPTNTSEVKRSINIPGGGTMPEARKGNGNSKEDKKTKSVNTDSELSEGKPDMKKIRPILMGVGVGILIIFAVLFSMGTFTDEKGNDDYTVLIAAPILIAAADYFIYSKLKTKYVISGKTNDQKKTEKGIVQKGQKEVFIPVTEVKTPVSAPPPMPPYSTNNPQPVTPIITRPVAPTEVTGREEQGGFQGYADYGKTEVLSDDMITPYLQSRGGNRIDISSQITRIGKLRDQVDVMIPNPKVSRIHADIVIHDGKLYVMDLGSANGTYINGNPNRITSNMEYELHNNDTVVFANEEYTVHC